MYNSSKYNIIEPCAVGGRDVVGGEEVELDFTEDVMDRNGNLGDLPIDFEEFDRSIPTIEEDCGIPVGVPRSCEAFKEFSFANFCRRESKAARRRDRESMEFRGDEFLEEFRDEEFPPPPPCRDRDDEGVSLPDENHEDENTPPPPPADDEIPPPEYDCETAPDGVDGD
uniref:Uncharacterized protein n=1 Tax=Panagrolaimus davidi TaxID=227884 RepID=A0A914R0D1_9BILA